MFSQKQSSGSVRTLKSFDEKFTVAYHKNQNDRYRTFYSEKKGTQKRMTREQAPLLLTPSSEKNKGVLGEEIYLFGREKFEGSRFLASSNHLRPFSSMWRKQSTPSKSHNGSWRLACVSSLHKRRFILFSYFLCLHFQEAPHHHECLALLRSLCLKNAKNW